MEDGRIPKDTFYEELAKGKRARGRLHIRFRDVCKRDMKSVDIDVRRWEDLAIDRNKWRQEVDAKDSPDRRQSSGKQLTTDALEGKTDSPSRLVM